MKVTEPRKHKSGWLIRTYAGFGDAETSNERFRQNLSRGQEGLSIAFDLPTQNGYDSDDRMAAGEVGGTGVAVCHLGDMRALLAGIDLGAINTSMTINATAPWLFSLYLALADESGVARERLRGTTQNDIMKEFVGRGTYVFSPAPSLRLQSDLIAFASERVPEWNPMNVCGYHYMESGAGPAEEVGFAMGNALLVLDALRPRVDAAKFAEAVRRISFFINSGIELVPELAKMRAYGRLWPILCEREYGVTGVRWRAGCQVRSLTLTEEQPEVNIVRIAYEALPAVLSASARVRALQLPGFREALGLPDQAEQTLALRTQQVLMFETGILEQGDIFEGSVIIERETDRTIAAAERVALELRSAGWERAITQIGQRLTVALVEAHAAVERGEQVRVGVNAFPDPVGAMRAPAYADDHVARDAAVDRHLARLAAWRGSREPERVSEARRALHAVAQGGGDTVEPSVALARAGGTTGEWTATLQEAFGGRYQAPLGTDVTVARSVEVPRAPRRIRLLLAKCGLDGHVNGVKLLAYACRDAGMEVIYPGLQQTPDAVAAAAVQESVDVIGVSSLAGAHMHLAREVREALARRGGADIPVVMGGIIPEADGRALRELGIAAVFTPSAGDVATIVQKIIEIAGSG